jgi:t-SNARE complex subunit (syntaxin)
MLDRVPALERTCAAKGWPCGQSWRNAFKRTNNSEETMVVMNQIEGKLDELSALTKLITEEPNNRMPLLGTIVSNRLNDAQLAFADGDVERALALAHEARRMQERGYWLPYALLAIVVLAVLVIGWVLIRRRHTPNKPGPTSTSNG